MPKAHLRGAGFPRLTAPARRLTTLFKAAVAANASSPEPMYKAVTRGIRVTVMPRFVEEESSPDDGRYFFAYTVEITNMSTERVQLKSRHWKIVDGHGQLQEVRGPGVVGKQPVLGPGETFSYTSGCPLTTPNGTMEGTYSMVTDQGESFLASIPAFSLDAPSVKRVMH
jgi:ApaG protein